ncbi:MAG: hypothetical protein KGJ82_13770, partial [Nitrospirota bacterium]|nr:hypothetical protein [Nitrospirota bacterium]
MTTATAKCEYLFSMHGVELHYQTSSPAFVAPVLAFLRHFHTDAVAGGRALTIRFEEVASRAEVPVKVSGSAKSLFSGARPSMGDSLRSIWRCDVKQDGDRLIADF